MAYTSIRERYEQLDRDKTQRRLVNAAAGTAATAALLRATPLGARTAVRAAKPIAWRPKSQYGRRAVAGVKSLGTGKRAEQLERSSTTTGIAAGLVGAASSRKWGSQLSRDIEQQESELERVRKADFAKAASESADWKEHVSPSAMRGHQYLRSGERKRRATSVGAGATSVAAAGLTAAALKARKPLVAAPSAVIAGSMVPVAQSKWQAAEGWKQKRRAIERRGQARAQGVPDGTTPDELRNMFGKAALPIPKAYPFRPQRTGGFYRRGTKMMYRRGTAR